MNNFKFEYNDAYELERLIKIYINIDKLYQKLYTLEIENKKVNEDYEKHINYLSLLIQGETDFYKEVNLTYEKAYKWAKLLLHAQKKSSKTNFNNQIISRIINNLLNIVSSNYNFLINLSNKELKAILKILGMRFKENTLNKNQIVHCIILKNSIEKDINNTFLSLLEEQIKSQKSDSIKEKLITSKYYMIYTHKDIERLVLINNFNIDNITYASSRVTKDVLNIEDIIYNNSNNLIGSTIAKAQIYELLEINNLDYSDITKVTTSILCQCMLTSSLLFLNNITLDEIKNDLQNFINDPEYQSIHENSSISKSIIDYCLNSIEKNKSKIKILSLK